VHDKTKASLSRRQYIMYCIEQLVGKPPASTVRGTAPTLRRCRVRWCGDYSRGAPCVGPFPTRNLWSIPNC